MESPFLTLLSNICRTPYDVLHILLYLGVLFIAILIALYKFDKNLFHQHVVLRYSFLAKILTPYVSKVAFLFSIFMTIFKKLISFRIWTPNSNRKTYGEKGGKDSKKKD